MLCWQQAEGEYEAEILYDPGKRGKRRVVITAVPTCVSQTSR